MNKNLVAEMVAVLHMIDQNVDRTGKVHNETIDVVRLLLKDIAADVGGFRLTARNKSFEAVDWMIEDRTRTLAEAERRFHVLPSAVMRLIERRKC